jgi:hypothetical protein
MGAGSSSRRLPSASSAPSGRAGCSTQQYFSTDLDEQVDLPDRRKVVRHEAVELRLERNYLRLVSTDIVKQLAYIIRYLQRRVAGWVVAPRSVKVYAIGLLTEALSPPATRRP